MENHTGSLKPQSRLACRSKKLEKKTRFATHTRNPRATEEENCHDLKKETQTPPHTPSLHLKYLV